MLEFGRGLSTDDEPDLWRKSLTGEIEQWIELGQPDEQRIRKACGHARQVVVISYSGPSASSIFQRFNLEWKSRTLKLFTQAA